MCMCILHIVFCTVCKYVLSICKLFCFSALSGARSQEFHSPRHLCCGDVTIKVIWFDLICFERVKLEVVKTAPNSQLLNLLSVGRLVTVLNEANKCGVVCKFQELNRGVFRCAVIRVEGEKQWGENAALRGLQCWWCGCWMRIFPASQAADPLTDGGGYRELCQFILKGVRDDGVKSGAEVYKQDPHINPWSVQMLQDYTVYERNT